MFGFGPWELLVVLIIVIFFYGGKRLPQIGDGLGRSISEFKKAIRGEDSPGQGGKKQLEPEDPPKNSDKTGASSRD